MAEGLTGLVDFKKDGQIGLTVGGQRYTLRQITLAEHRRLRDLYSELQAEVTDHLEFDINPALVKARESVTGTETKAARAKARKALADIEQTKDRFVQGAWARWWREAVNTLSSKPLPEANPDDPADGLEPWMVDSPGSISPMFKHWRSVPLGSAGDDRLTQNLAAILQDGLSN